MRPIKAMRIKKTLAVPPPKPPPSGGGGAPAPGHSVVASPSYASGSGFTSTISTGAVTATVTGGVGPFTYALTVSNQTGTKTVFAVSPTSASSIFRITGASSGSEGDADAQWTVADTGNGGALSVSNVVSVTITNNA